LRNKFSPLAFTGPSPNTMNLAAAATALHLSPSIRQSRLTLAAAVQGFKARTLVPGLLTLACLLVAAPATAQVNYAVSGSTAWTHGMRHD
jgi:hypothetical protein